MAAAPTPERRRKVAALSAAEAAAEEPSLLIEVKRLVAEVDALDDEARAELAAELSRNWPRLFRGCAADKNRARYSAYRSSRAQLQALHNELDALLNH